MRAYSAPSRFVCKSRIYTIMKFVNREYGFEGRPPFVKDFSDIRSESLSPAEKNFPQGPFVALGAFPRTPNGVVIAGEKGSLWELKFSYFKNGKWIDSEAFGEVSPRYVAGDPDGKFRYVCHGDVAVSMVRYSKRAAVLSLVVLDKVRIKLSFTSLTPSGLTTDIRAGDARASSFGRAILRGSYALEEDFFRIEGRYEALPEEGDGAEREYARAVIICGGEAGEYVARADGADYETVLDTDNSRVAAYIVAGSEEDTAYAPSLEEVNRGVNKAELDYSANKPVGAGALAEFASEIFAKTVSHKIYNPYRDDTEYAEDVAGTDENFSAEPTAFAIGGLCAALTGDANVEQCVMSAGEPAAGALAAWTAFMRTRDRTLLERVYPVWKSSLKEGLKLVTDEGEFKKIGYKAANSPLRDLNKEPVYCLEYNSYRLLLADITVRAARVLGDIVYAGALAAERDNFRKRFHETFYNKERGLYMDRYVSGEFTGVFGAASFLPLAAGAVPDNDVLDALISNLTDEKLFLNSAPVPHIAMRDPRYGKPSVAGKAARSLYLDYTGSSVPYVDYLIYLGLVRYGALDAEAELAKRLANVWRNYYRRMRAVPDRLLPNFKFDDSGIRDSLSGNLTGIIGVNELLDVEYFGEDIAPAVRFGTLLPGEHRIANVKIFGRNMSYVTDGDASAFSVDGVKVLEGVGGPFTVRYFTECVQGPRFLLYTRKPLTLKIYYPVFEPVRGAGNVLRFNIDPGKYSIGISGKRFFAERI